MPSYVLWLDDYREPSDLIRAFAYNHSAEIVIARNYDEFIETILNRGAPIHIAFDHDLADEHYAGDFSKEKTGMDCAKWLQLWMFEDMSRVPSGFSYTVHSMNPGGAENIRSFMRQVLAYIREFA